MKDLADLARYFIGPLIVIALLIALAVALSRPARAGTREFDELLILAITNGPIHPVLRERKRTRPHVQRKPGAKR